MVTVHKIGFVLTDWNLISDFNPWNPFYAVNWRCKCTKWWNQIFFFWGGGVDNHKSKIQKMGPKWEILVLLFSFAGETSPCPLLLPLSVRNSANLDDLQDHITPKVDNITSGKINRWFGACGVVHDKWFI